MEFVIVPIFFLIALGGMLLALKFSKYKEDGASCCGGGHCSSDGKSNGHKSCYQSKVDFMDDKFGKEKNSLSDLVKPLES